MYIFVTARVVLKLLSDEFKREKMAVHNRVYKTSETYFTQDW